MFGEGSGIFILEELEHAKARGATMYAEILGYGTSFDPKSHNVCSPKAEGAIETIKQALKDADVSADEIGYISASANSTVDCDVMETRAIKNVFKDSVKDIAVSSIKSVVGESFSASGALNLASSLCVLKENFLPPTLNYREVDKRCDLDYVADNKRDKRVDKILINSFSPTGNNSALVIGRYE